MKEIKLEIQKQDYPCETYIDGLGKVAYVYYSKANQIDIQAQNSGVYSLSLNGKKGSIEINGMLLKVFVR